MFFKSIAILSYLLLYSSQHVVGQEYINPAKNLSVSIQSDTLVFKKLVSNQLMYMIKLKNGIAPRYLKFSPSGNLLITSGNDQATNIYSLHIDTATLTATLPISAGEVVYNSSEKELYILHSSSPCKSTISAYSTKSWEKLADVQLPFQAHDLTIDALGAVLGLCEGNNIYCLNTWNLTADKLYTQKASQRLLQFNPSVPYQSASVNAGNHIEIKDLKKDSVIWEINAHSSTIVWLGFDPTGKLLVSLDKKGYLFTWMLAKRNCIAQLRGVAGVPVFNANGTLNLSANGNGEEPGFVQLHHSKTH